MKYKNIYYVPNIDKDKYFAEDSHGTVIKIPTHDIELNISIKETHQLPTKYMTWLALENKKKELSRMLITAGSMEFTVPLDQEGLTGIVKEVKTAIDNCDKGREKDVLSFSFVAENLQSYNTHYQIRMYSYIWRYILKALPDYITEMNDLFDKLFTELQKYQPDDDLTGIIGIYDILLKNQLSINVQSKFTALIQDPNIDDFYKQVIGATDINGFFQKIDVSQKIQLLSDSQNQIEGNN